MEVGVPIDPLLRRVQLSLSFMSLMQRNYLESSKRARMHFSGGIALSVYWFYSFDIILAVETGISE